MIPESQVAAQNLSSQLSLPESELVARVHAGETDRFLDLIRPYERSLKLICRSFLHNQTDAEDAMQEALVKAFSHLHQLRNGESFKSWLLQIAVNEARMIRRKRETDGSATEDGEEDQMAFKPRDFNPWSELPSAALERKETGKEIERALASLSPMYREVFVLRDVQSFSTEQASRMLGISESTVMMRLHRARLQMRDLLAPLFRKQPVRWKPLSMLADMGMQMLHRSFICKELVCNLSSYVDGQLQIQMRREIEKHLRYCTRCRVLVDSTRKLLYIVANEKYVEVPVNSEQFRGLCDLLRKNSITPPLKGTAP
jgi:RNA polymerase sigma-70 factor (ECF subfamily)